MLPVLSRKVVEHQQAVMILCQLLDGLRIFRLIRCNELRAGSQRGQVLLFAMSGNNFHMPRPLRIEFAGELYHVTSSGDEREVIFLSDEDRHNTGFWTCYRRSCETSTGLVHAYCSIPRCETATIDKKQDLTPMFDVLTLFLYHWHENLFDIGESRTMVKAMGR